MCGGVAILTSLFPPSVGGIQTQTLALARGLVSLGTEVHVVTRPAPDHPARAEEAGVTVHRVGLSRGPGVATTLAYVALAARTVRALAGRVALVHAHQMLSPSSAALLGCALGGVPFVVTAHASGSIGEVTHLRRQGPLGRARLAALRRRASAFVAVSDAIRDELVRAGIPGDRIRRIPNGVDPVRFAPASAAERRDLRATLRLPPEPLAVYAGRLAPEKGVDVLLEAWAEARRRGLRGSLAVVGDGPERERLAAQAIDLAILDSARFAGATADVSPWLRAADVLVLPSRTEGLSVALLEGMSCGLAVVATDVGATRETAGEGALVVPPERPRAFAEALRAVLGDAERARAMGTAGRARAVGAYGIDAVAARHLALYREVTASARARDRGDPPRWGEGGLGRAGG
jgi:glycosyltransferase involved in cell wall biosynthesis